MAAFYCVIRFVPPMTEESLPDALLIPFIIFSFVLMTVCIAGMACLFMAVNIDSEGISQSFFVFTNRMPWHAIKKVNRSWPMQFYKVSSEEGNWTAQMTNWIKAPAPWVVEDESLYWKLIDENASADCPLRNMFSGRKRTG